MAEEKLNLSQEDLDDLVITPLRNCLRKAERLAKESMPAFDRKTWLDTDISIVRLRLALAKELKAQIEADTKQLCLQVILRAALPWRDRIARLWRFARVSVSAIRLWASR